MVTRLRNKQTGKVVDIQFYQPDYFAYPPDVWEVISEPPQPQAPPEEPEA